MTATEILCRLLDERGVEWWPSDDPCCEGIITHWRVGPFQWTAIEGEKDLWLNAGIAEHEPLTPEQAIAATLGSSNCTNGERTNGTCHTVAMDCFGNPPYNTSGLNGNSTACGCSECGAPWSTMGIFRGNQLKHNFKACPICGRKVVAQ